MKEDGIEPAPTTAFLYGQNAPKVGVAPAVVLVDPKHDHNVGTVIRAASCFGARQVWFTGDRVQIATGRRLPREERMRGYGDVELCQADRPFDAFEGKGVTPVAIELRPGSENLGEFEHPENPVYVFGPEDGSVPPSFLRLCHRFVVIPSYHCVNLAAAVYIVLYDRMVKRVKVGLMEYPTVAAEGRGRVRPVIRDLKT